MQIKLSVCALGEGEPSLAESHPKPILKLGGGPRARCGFEKPSHILVKQRKPFHTFLASFLLLIQAVASDKELNS